MKEPVDMRGHEDGGFTLVEMMVAMVIMSVVLLGLMGVQVRSLTTVGLAGQRQNATAQGNRVMEQLRSLPYGTVTGGLACSDLVASDPNLTMTGSATGCSATFHPTYDSAINEPVVTTSSAGQIPPLNPHVQPTTATTIGNVQYKVRDYITRVNPDPTVDAGYWLTVIVTWQSNATHNVPITIGTRSQLYSPTGCLATTTHPFSGPCQAFFYSDAGTTAGGITVQSTRTGQTIVDGVDVVTGGVTLPGTSTRTQSEQIVSAQSDATTSALKLTGLAGSTTAGGVSAVSTADTDPSTGVPSSPGAASTATQSSSTVSANGGGGQFALVGGPSDTGSALSTMTATATPACADAGGSSLTTGQACSAAAYTPGTVSSAKLRLNSLGAQDMTLADATLASPARAYGARFIAGSGGHCTGTSGVGCVAAGARRTITLARAGIFPSGFLSGVGTTPLVAVSGYDDLAAGESGIAPGGATLTRSGTLTYWNGTGFTPVVLATIGAATYTVPYVSGVSGATTVAVSGTVTVSAPSAPSTGSSPCQPTACTVKASGGTVVAQLTYTVTTGSTQVGAFTVTLDLGSSLAQTTYKGAPSA
jgi:prepilin-type N-terminal cleavage/methylation domain-containing protein